MSSIWNRLVDAATQIFGIVPVANGGTGLASGTSGGVPYYSASGTIASSGALTASRIVLGGGAGATPASLAFGTANQVLGMNNGASAYEHKTMAVGTSGSDFGVANAANSITFNLPDAASGARGAVTTGTQTFAGAKTFSSLVTPSVGIAGQTSGPTVATGTVGEVLSATFGSAGTATGTQGNIGSLVLTAGVWIIQGFATYTPTGTTGGSFCQLGIGTTSATLPTRFTQFNVNTSGVNLGLMSITTPITYISTTGATIYLVQQTAYSAGTVTFANGQLQAFRIG